MACFQGEDPTNVLVSYTMCVYGICSQQDYHSRVKIRYLFDAFCNGMIQMILYHHSLNPLTLLLVNVPEKK